MNWESLVAILSILLALGFDFVNGFHDTANAVATVIYTKALRPGVAIAMSGLLNFLGAVLVGTAVALVITKIIPHPLITLQLLVAVLSAAVLWNLITWWFGLPVSSSHCLIGSLFGAGIAANGLGGVGWQELDKVLMALLISPVVGFIAGAVVTWVTCLLSGEYKKAEAAPADPEQPKKKVQSPIMRWLHVLSSGCVSFSHGSNDGQKTMGIITLILASHFPQFGFVYNQVPWWVMISAASAIALGTVIGGWRVIRTVGTKISKEKLTHAQGFGASMSTAAIILVASSVGAPISTTHTLSSAVAGGTIPAYGASKLNVKTLWLIVLAWVLTLPVAATLSACCYLILHLFWH